MATSTQVRVSGVARTEVTVVRGPSTTVTTRTATGKIAVETFGPRVEVPITVLEGAAVRIQPPPDHVNVNVVPAAQQVEVNVDLGGRATSSSSTFHWGTGLPGAALGAVDDAYIDENTGILYRKTAADTWTPKLVMATSVTNTHVYFRRPNGDLGRAPISNFTP